MEANGKGMGIIGMVLTQCSVGVCLEKIGGYNIYGHNRRGSDTRPRYAVTAPRRGACTCGLFNTGGALMGMLLRSTTFRLYGRKRITYGLHRHGSDTMVRSSLCGKHRGVQRIWA